MKEEFSQCLFLSSDDDFVESMLSQPIRRSKRINIRKKENVSPFHLENARSLKVRERKINSKTSKAKELLNNNIFTKKNSSGSDLANRRTPLNSETDEFLESICNEKIPVSNESHNSKRRSSKKGESSSDSIIFEESSSFYPEKKRKLTNRKMNTKQVKLNSKVNKSEECKSSDESDWENIEENHHSDLDEVEYIKSRMIDLEQSKNNKVPPENSKEMIVIELTKKKRNSNPEQLAKRALRDGLSNKHLFHLIAMLAFGEIANSLADSHEVSNFAFSLINLHISLEPSKVTSVAEFKPILDICESIIDHQSRIKAFTESAIFQCFLNKSFTPNHAKLVLISILRVLGFDARLILRFNSFIYSTYEKSKKKTVISSETKSTSSNSFSFLITCDVYIPAAKDYFPIEFSDENKALETDLVYAFAFHSSFLIENENFSYQDRSPADVAIKYDKNWCIGSQEKRLPLEDIKRLISFAKIYSNASFIINKGDILSKKLDSELYKRDQNEILHLKEALYLEPIPKTVNVYKKHPLYVLKRNLLKYEVIYPLNARIFGSLKNDENVYSRDCVYLCHTPETWIKQAKSVKSGEIPIKTVKARMTLKTKVIESETDNERMSDLYGEWQVEDYKPPIAEDGIVPRNPYNNVDVYLPCMIPIGCCHLNLPGLNQIARELNIDCVPAVVGWNFSGCVGFPQKLGYIVCKENVHLLIDAWKERRKNRAIKEQEKISKRAINNWRQVVKNLFIWQRVKLDFEKPY